MTGLKRLAASVFAAGLVPALVGQQNPPAPSVDNVGFPANYRTNMNVLYVFDRPDNKTVNKVYANAPVFTVQRNGTQSNYPYGSILVLETWQTLKDTQGVPILDGSGRYQPDPSVAPGAAVMRKEKGFGVDYGPNRNGEWEYAAYRADGTPALPPQQTFICAVCHLQAGQGKDWVFRAALHFSNASGAVPGAVIKAYAFVPGTMHVKAGSTLTMYNDDVVAHTIADDVAGGFQSAVINAGGSIDLKFPDTPFEWDFHCSIHPAMKGKIIVDP